MVRVGDEDTIVARGSCSQCSYSCESNFLKALDIETPYPPS